jgi:hypothetical protein
MALGLIMSHKIAVSGTVQDKLHNGTTTELQALDCMTLQDNDVAEHIKVWSL